MKNLLENVSLPKLSIGMLITCVCALGIHALMIQTLGVAYPGIKIDAPIPQFISREFFPALALIFLSNLLQEKMKDRHFIFRCVFLFLLFTMVQESFFRVPFMNGYCSNSLLFNFIKNIPKMLPVLALSTFVIAITPYSQNFLKKAGAALLLAALNLFILTPIFAYLFEGILRSLQFLSHPGWCELPYGWNVLIPAYVSFVEPVLASMAVAALIWNKLSEKPIARVFQFVLLIMIIRRHLFFWAVYMAYSGQPAMIGLASAGQFTLEAFILGLLTALTWKWAQQHR